MVFIGDVEFLCKYSDSCWALRHAWEEGGPLLAGCTQIIEAVKTLIWHQHNTSTNLRGYNVCMYKGKEIKFY